MKKTLIQLGLLGFPLGIAIGYVITLFISIGIGDNCYYPVNQELINTAGTELNAVLLQTFLCGIVGSLFSMGSVVWDIDSWSLTKQTGVYFVIACLAMFPIAYFAGWMPHSVVGAALYVGIFIAIFAICWITQYLSIKHKVNEMNAGLNKF